MTLMSKLFVGSVSHHRLRPSRHRLRYRMFWLLLDLDEVDVLPQRLALFSHNRFNAVSFHDVDHGDGSSVPLRAQIAQRLGDAGVDGAGRIGLLCMPRIFGYGFNPLSIYFCHDRQRRPSAIIYEVHNTFGERHSYLFPVRVRNSPVLEHRCCKVFHVSPFLAMDLRYTFRVRVGEDQVSVAVKGWDRDGPVIAAALVGRRAPLTPSMLARLLVSHPLLTLKVIAAIHWHALRMVLKGFSVHRKPPAPEAAFTLNSEHDSQ